MSIIDSIERIRNKPKRTRNAYAFWTAFIVTAFIFTIWTSSLPARVNHVLTLSATSTQEMHQGPSVWQRVRTSFGHSLAALQAAFGSDAATSTPPAAATTTAPGTSTPAIVMPTVSPSTSTPAAEPILIATTSENTATSGANVLQ